MAKARPRTFRVVRWFGEEQQYFHRGGKCFLPVKGVFDGFEDIPFQYIAKAVRTQAREHAIKRKEYEPKGTTDPAIQYLEDGVIKWEDE